MDMLSANEKTGIHTLSLYIVRSIVKQHGGTIERNHKKQTVGVIVPADKRASCSDEITRQLGAMQEHLSVILLGCMCGKVIIRASRN